MLKLVSFTAYTQSRIFLLYGGPTLNYGKQLFLYVSHMLRVNMTRDLPHLQLSDLQGETGTICRTSELQDPYTPNVKAIISL